MREEELQAALKAFNEARITFNGIKTDEQFRYAMNQALDAAQKVRASWNTIP